MIHITIDDLETTCPVCTGLGNVTHPDWAEWWISHVEMPPEDHPLTVNEVPESLVCLECHGRGTIPTEQGSILLRFLKKHI